MLLVPRQLKRSGMTGAVPYYGGRFTPAQAYAASHPQGAPPSGSPTAWNPLASAPPPPPSPAASPPGPAPAEALKGLLDSGVLTGDEYERLLTRTRR
ncbi:MAG TPA: hypothetical protein VF140_06430 [Phycicoccus sp.]